MSEQPSVGPAPDGGPDAEGPGDALYYHDYLHLDRPLGAQEPDAYRLAVERMTARERELIERNPTIGEARRAEQLEQFERTVAHFEITFDPERYQEVAEREGRRLSHEAFLAALLIHLYRDEPILHVPFRLLNADRPVHVPDPPLRAAGAPAGGP